VAFLDENPALGFPAAAVFGAALGSFLNVVILRLPRRREWQWKRDSREVLGEPELYDPPPPGIVVERSHCPHCKAQLRWYENIPLVSWAIQGGKCRHCGAPISLQYPLVELVTMLLVLACVWRFGFGWQGFGAIVLTGFLVALSGIDLRTQLLPDQLTLPLLWLGLCSSSSPARKAWAMAISSCWLRWAPGSGCRASCRRC
jgi:leader peptidase (prepilin peptidase)/N-methyltransferase